jgi:hypothetical protein
MTKRVSTARKQKQLLRSIIPYIFGIVFVAGILLYLWMYSEIDETLQETENLVLMVSELTDDINLLKDDIEYLTRVDVITNRAKMDLGMVFTAPETIEKPLKYM